eukprot:m.666077 g.666077  ORF g.666077 m.666077 type:complete len:284 (-) comp22748_c0_seq47:2444-3295(-)
MAVCTAPPDSPQLASLTPMQLIDVAVRSFPSELQQDVILRLEASHGGGAAPNSTYSHDSRDHDRFKIQLSVDDTTSHWEINFGHDSSQLPPDFVFTSTKSFAPSLTQIPSLLRWNPQDPKAMVNVMTELVSAFRDHHIKLVRTHPVALIGHEYDSTASDAFRAAHGTVSWKLLGFPPGVPEIHACQPVRFTMHFAALHSKFVESPIRRLLESHPPVLDVDFVPGSTGVTDVSSEHFMQTMVQPHLTISPVSCLCSRCICLPRSLSPCTIHGEILSTLVFMTEC